MFIILLKYTYNILFYNRAYFIKKQFFAKNYKISIAHIYIEKQLVLSDFFLDYPFINSFANIN